MVTDIFASGLYDVDRLLGFLLVVSRVAGLLVFVPVPGAGSSPIMARIVLCLAISICLSPLGRTVPGLEQSLPRLAGCMAVDATIGMVLGLTVAFTIEALKLAAQAAGLQAGFGYASTIDPSSDVDTSLLLVTAELFAGMLFFAAGLDRQVLAILAGTLHTMPPGQAAQIPAAPQALARLGGEMIAYGLRLAFPVIALLLLVDLTLGFLGRVNAQLQLLTLAFPVKILAALGLFALLAPVYARVYQAFAQHGLDVAGRILLRR